MARDFSEELARWSDACAREKAKSGLEMWVIWNLRDHEMQNWPVRTQMPQHWRLLFSTCQDEKRTIYDEEMLKQEICFFEQKQQSLFGE